MSTDIRSRYNLPNLTGVYLFKNKDNQIIYIGKAKSIYARVKSYFAKKSTDIKINELIKEHDNIEHIVTLNEYEALLLEAHLIRTFQPKYNILLKDGNPFLYLYIDSHSIKVIDNHISNNTLDVKSINKKQIPKLEIVRNKKHKGVYFGPFLHKSKIRSICNNLLRTFKIKLCSKKIKNGCLDYHMGNCAGSCLESFDIKYYLDRLTLVKELLKNDHKSFKKELSEQIKYHNTNLNFEKSKNLNTYLDNFELFISMLKSHVNQTKYFKDAVHITANYNNKLDRTTRGSQELKDLLHLNKKPVTIDCFDISHFQSNYIVGSCIRFSYGLPDKNSFRKFKVKSLKIQNDYKALQEVVSRRYSKNGDFPDIILIDGGKGQLSAINDIKDIIKIPSSTEIISLAKKEETLHLSNENNKEEVLLDLHNNASQLLIALRDYAHHFAISYHKLLRSKKNFN